MRSVEEQDVSASLRCIEASQRVGVETLFAVYAVFPEDVTVPTSVIDALAPLILARAANRSVDYTVPALRSVRVPQDTKMAEAAHPLIAPARHHRARRVGA